jgi:hypothetical protein
LHSLWDCDGVDCDSRDDDVACDGGAAAKSIEVALLLDFKSACVAACGIAAAVLGYTMLAINNLVRGKREKRETFDDNLSECHLSPPLLLPVIMRIRRTLRERREKGKKPNCNRGCVHLVLTLLVVCNMVKNKNKDFDLV